MEPLEPLESFFARRGLDWFRADHFQGKDGDVNM
jgi:hypothetical protein